MKTKKIVYVMGISCEVTREKCVDGKLRDVYRYTVPGWSKCGTVGLRETKRVINARLSPAARYLCGIK